MSADRAGQLAETAGDILATAECARQLAVSPAKRDGTAKPSPSPCPRPTTPTCGPPSPDGTATRGLLIQSAAYSLARSGDRDGMRQLTAEAADIAEHLGNRPLLHDHGGGFGHITVQLHRISAGKHAGDPHAALAAARTIPLAALPSTERRSRVLAGVATAHHRLGRRAATVSVSVPCVFASSSPLNVVPRQEIHVGPAIWAFVSGLLLSGPASAELGGLAIQVVSGWGGVSGLGDTVPDIDDELVACSLTAHC